MLVRGGSPARYARRNPDSPCTAIIAQNRRARRVAAANGCSSIFSLGRPGGHRSRFVNSQSESMGWATKFGRARGFLYNFALSDNAFPSQGFSMSDQSGVNRGRRSLVIASACAGGAATVATAVPFAASMLPSERVYKNKPAPDNLRVPPYMYLSDNRILIAEDKKVA